VGRVKLQSDDAKKEPVTLAGNEARVIDSLIAVVHPRARLGDPVAVDQVIRLLDLRLRYKRQTNTEEPW
jgi:hypothetical protein